jgi:hypothetical protein
VPAHFSGTYSNWKCGANGKGYSPSNAFWLQLQDLFDPTVEGPYGPFGEWKRHGRFPKKGSKARTVLKPVFVYKKETDAKGVETKVRIGPIDYVPIKSAFPYSVTDGEPLKGVEKMPDDWDLDRALEKLEIKRIKFNMIDGNVQGYSQERKFALNPVAAHPMKTTFHELAHIVLGHTTKEEASEYKLHRGLKEFQAEAVAYILAHELDLTDWDAAESRAYIRTWLKGGEVPDKAIRQVFAAVSRILEAGRSAAESEGELDQVEDVKGAA